MSEIFFGKRPEYVLYHINAFVGTGLGFAQCSQSPGEGFPSSSPPGRLAGRRGEQREKAEGGGEGRVSWEEWAGSGAWLTGK